MLINNMLYISIYSYICRLYNLHLIERKMISLEVVYKKHIKGKTNGQSIESGDFVDRNELT